MPYLANTTELGNLEIKNIYINYDFPRLFSCANQYGEIYLVLSVGESDFYCQWIYMPVSKERLLKIESGEIDLKDAFKNSENGKVWNVSIPIDIDDKIDLVSSSSIPDKVLPKAGIKIGTKID